MIFTLLFFFGFVGVVAMAFLGMGHHATGGGSHAGGHLNAGASHGLLGLPHGHASGSAGHGASHSAPGLPAHGSNPGLARGQSPAPSIGAVPAHPPVHDGDSGRSFVSYLPTPLDLFSFCVGAGLSGALFQKVVLGSSIWIIAALGGLVFDFLVVRQIFALAFKFASKPSLGLEALVASPAEAITRFDDKGMGMVRVVMEGQVVQLLATLSPSESASGVTVHKGDQVILLEVDPKRNTCFVTRELSDLE